MTENKTAIVRPEENGVIHIAEEVIASIIALAATEVDGVSSLTAGAGVDWNELLGKKNISKGVKLVIEDNSISADIYLNVKYDFAVSSVAQKVQENVKAALFNMAGLETTAINVHVCGISFSKGKNS